MPTTSYRYAPLTPADRPAWADLLAVAFDRQPAAMCHLLDWLHAGYPLTAWGAWDDDAPGGTRLAAQYACLEIKLQLPGEAVPVAAGMSLNMCVHPDYRGQGLIKHVSRPVYATLQDQGSIAGTGFSNAEGVQVDRNSKGYGYLVVGQMQTFVAYLPRLSSAARACLPGELRLTDHLLSDLTLSLLPSSTGISLPLTAAGIVHRYAAHPFRGYQYALWQVDGNLRGIVVYRRTRLRGITGVSLLGVYAAPDDLTPLLRLWAHTLRTQGVALAHLLASPGAAALGALREAARCLPVPTRSPMYLTIKPLDNRAEALFNFALWDCTGGDIL